MGPLNGIRVVEMAAVGPTPFCAMMLADAGADVIQISRNSETEALSGARDVQDDPLLRGRRRLRLDLKEPGAIDVVLQLVAASDVLLEGFRPGVMERLGLGPQTCLSTNPRLVYGRMTGWGQTGPLSAAAGHDLNYIALSGALHATGTARQPIPPLNLVGDFGGGAMMLAFGVTAALLEARRSGEGQVVDAAMSDGAALLMAPFYAMCANGSWIDRRHSNVLDGAAPYYGTYACKDGGFISIAPLEARFYDKLLAILEIDDPLFRDRSNRSHWPELQARFASVFLGRTRSQWCDLLEATDACFAPVLGIAEAPHHHHNIARHTFIKVGNSCQPAPAPRYSRTVNDDPQPLREGLETSRQILTEAGFDPLAISRMIATGVLSAT
jgi:alpha-methylacyl-CoA racemase